MKKHSKSSTTSEQLQPACGTTPCEQDGPSPTKSDEIEQVAEGSRVFSGEQHAALTTASTKKKNTRPKNTKGKKRRPPGYTSHSQMKQRCKNEKLDAYANYGGRGISYDPAWETYEAFIKDMGPPPTPGHSLDRLDPNGNYEKQNCVWATKKEQTRNRRMTRHVEYKGEPRVLAEVAEENGLSPDTLARRLRQGTPIEEAVSKPVSWGGDRTRQPITRSEHNRWPPSLRPQAKEIFEKNYLQGLNDNPTLTRPKYFLDSTERQAESIAENHGGDPENGLGQEYNERADRLMETRSEAAELCLKLGIRP